MKTKITSAICNFTLYILLFCTSDMFGQKTLKDTMLQVVKSFQPTIADAYKINDMPIVKDSIPPLPQLTYGINSKKVFTPFTVEPLKPAKMVGEPLTKLYRSLLKLGAGNYLYGEYFYNNLRSKDISYGAHLKHLSYRGTMDGYGYSGFSDNEAGIYGKKFLRKYTLSGNLDYNRNVIHYYGYNPDTGIHTMTAVDMTQMTKQYYSRVGGNASLQSHYTDSVRPNYLLDLKYYNLSDYYNTAENNVHVAGDVSAYYEKQLVHVPLSVDYYNNKSGLDTTYSVITKLAPHITSSGAQWNSRIGMGIAMEGNQNNKSRFSFYPNIDFNYNLADNILVPYAGFAGGLKENTLQTLTGENPFLVPDPRMKSTNENWKMYGGLRGSISKTVSYNTHTSYSKLEDMYFFVNDNSDFFKKGFNVIYDDANLWNVHGELQFQYAEKIKLMANGDYNQYDMTNELKPWHKPLWQASLSANYNLRNKIVATANLFVYGTRFSYNPAQGQGTNVTVVASSIHELKTIVDANIGMEYRYSKKLSAFLNLNNLGFSRYYFWNNYASQKFNFLAGLSLSF